MRTDPIVDEIHRIREKISEEHGHDIRAIGKAAKAREGQSGHEVVSFAPQSVEKPMVLKEEK